MSAEASPPPPPSDSPKPSDEQPHPSSAEQTALPPFEPLFTLLSNATTNTTSHPRVHYIFSDDEPTVLPPSRSILIDLEAADTDGWAVKSASSLSGDFAVTDARLEGESTLRIEGVQREVVAAQGPPLGRSKDGLGRSVEGREDVEGLLEDFRRRMGVLDKVVEQGERSVGHLKIRQEEQQEEGLEPQQQQPQEQGGLSQSGDKGKDKAEES